jgi:predicted TIM-barrel enzyme
VHRPAQEWYIGSLHITIGAAVIVSGSRSPDPPSFERVRAVRDSVPAPVLIGSGVSLANVADSYATSDGVLIGEIDFKVDRVWGGRSDGRAYAEAVRRCR